MESDVSKSRLQVVVPVPMCFLPVCQQVSGLWPQTLSEEGLMQGERAQDA